MADLIFSLAFARVLRSTAKKLEDAGLVTYVHGDEQMAPFPAAAADVSIGLTGVSYVDDDFFCCN